MALGVMGLTVSAFEEMTPSDFLTAYTGYMWKLEREQKSRASTLVSIINTCGNLKKGKRMKLQDFYKEAHIDPRNPFYRRLLGI